jgi:hypothetical protein
MRRSTLLRVFVMALLSAVPATRSTHAQDVPKAAAPYAWKVGTAKVDVTPKTSMWMAGYASRKKPSERTALPVNDEGMTECPLTTLR